MLIRNKIVQVLYEVVIYVFPFILLLLILVSFQIWKLENTKEKMTRTLHDSKEMIEAARKELYAMRMEVVTTGDSFSYYADKYAFYPGLRQIVPTTIEKQKLVELGLNVLKRVDQMKEDSTDYLAQHFVLTEATNRYYAIVISYSELEYAIVQREHLVSLGFENVKILVNNKLFALSIDDSAEKNDPLLRQSIDKWNQMFNSGSDGFVKKF